MTSSKGDRYIRQKRANLRSLTEKYRTEKPDLHKWNETRMKALLCCCICGPGALTNHFILITVVL